MLALAERCFPHHEQHPQRAAADGAVVPDGLRPHAGHPHRRPRPFGRRERRAVRLPGRERDQAHRLAAARRGNRHRLRRHGRACQRHAGDGAAHPVVHRHLRHDVDAHRRHLLLHGRRNHSRLPAGFPPARQRLSVRRADAGLCHGAVPVDRRAVRAAHRLGPADLCDRRQSGRRAAVRRAGRAAAACWSTR